MAGEVLDFFGFGPKARAYIRVRGQVYEGAYHLYVQRRVRAYGLQGWMRTHHLALESFLEMDLEGTRHRLDKLLEDLQKGPATARVFGAEVQWKTYKNELRGLIIRG